jgi:hypothetical protein
VFGGVFVSFIDVCKTQRDVNTWENLYNTAIYSDPLGARAPITDCKSGK